jgi:hypothetical protein
MVYAPPNIENLTIPGGIVLFFDTGSGMVDLGFIDAVDLEPKSTELEYWSNRSGKRRKAKVFSLEEALALTFKLNEPVVANMQAFFKGGTLTPVSAGTANVVDQLVTLHGLRMTSVGKYGLTAVSAKTLADVALDVNVDFIVDPGAGPADGLQVGRIGRLAAGDIADGQTIKVSYTYVIWDAITFPVCSEEFVQGAARLEFHPSTGLKGNLHIPLCQLKPNGKMTLDDKKVLEVPMTLEVLDNYAATPTTPYGYWEALSES